MPVARGLGALGPWHALPSCSLPCRYCSRSGNAEGRAVGFGSGDDGAAPQALRVRPWIFQIEGRELNPTEVHGDGGEHFAEDAEPYGMGPGEGREGEDKVTFSGRICGFRGPDASRGGQRSSRFTALSAVASSAASSAGSLPRGQGTCDHPLRGQEVLSAAQPTRSG